MVGLIRFSGYGPFSGDGYEIELAPRVTLIVGRNNSGKSFLIDLICRAYDTLLGRDAQLEPASMYVKADLSGTVGDEYYIWDDADEYDDGDNLIDPSILKRCENFGTELGEQVFEKHDASEHPTLIRESWLIPDEGLIPDELKPFTYQVGKGLGYQYARQCRSTRVRRLAAERDIVPERVEDEQARLYMAPNGEGATLVVEKVINDSGMDEAAIEGRLLRSFNVIMGPDVRFDEIRVQRNEGGSWEVYLREPGRSRVPLSSMGSGVKTVLLMLLNLYVAGVDDAKRTESIYLFEELENCLHPALQRRMFEFLYEHAAETGERMVITSHSPAAINAFYGRDGVAVYQVERPRDAPAVLRRVESDDGCRGVLDDLGINASDLLQANGVVWVEGPSDRVYIKSWLELARPGEFVEGVHYQFLFYGGRLLSHYRAGDARAEADEINVLTANRHAAIVMDSDMRSDCDTINSSKRRVCDEFEERGLISWVTAGREVENYLSQEALARVLPNAPDAAVGRYGSFPEHIEGAFPGFAGNKVAFARKVAGRFVESDLDVLDLRERIEVLALEIERWNK